MYASHYNIAPNKTIVDTDEHLQNGLYLKAFANGIDTVLEDNYESITELERLYIYQQLQVYEPLVLFLRILIRGIRTQKLHGCAIIRYLYQNMQHRDERIYRAMRSIQAEVNVVFVKQLTHWILYAKIVDSYAEFFIQCAETRDNSTMEICYEFLPHYLSVNWPEKVLFIGQTNKTEKNAADGEDSLWNEKEHIYFGKIQVLYFTLLCGIEHLSTQIKSTSFAKLEG